MQAEISNEATESNDPHQLGEEIAEIAAHLDAGDYRLLVLLREFDELDGWSPGFNSCAHWLSWRTGLSLNPAREKVRVARALPDLPLISEELRSGRLSYSKVRAMTRVASPATEEELVIFARHAATGQLERVIRAWRRVDRQVELEEVNERHIHRSASAYFDEDGMFVLRARLDPEVGAVVMRALDAARDQLYQEGARVEGSVPSQNGAGGEAERNWTEGSSRPDGEADELVQEPETSYSQSLADAVGLVAECALGEGLGASSKGDRFQVVVHVDNGVLESVSSEVSSEPVPSDAVPSKPASSGELDVSAETSTDLEIEADQGRKAEGTREACPCVSAETFGSGENSALEDGIRLAPETSRRLACDASRVVMTHDPVAHDPVTHDPVTHDPVTHDLGTRQTGSAQNVSEAPTLSVGRKTRTIPPALRRALEHRDVSCRFPGCTNRICDAHHVRHWADGGETRMENLVLLCRVHHRLVHEGGYGVELMPDGEARFTRPDRSAFPYVPGLPWLPDQPAEALVARHAKDGLEIEAGTSSMLGSGGTLDLNLAVTAFRGLAEES